VRYRFLVGLRAGRLLLAGSSAILVVTGLVVLFVDRFPWWGSPMAAVDWTVGTNILVGPMAAGLAAMLYTRMTSTGWTFFLRGTRRGVGATAAPGIVVAVAAVVGLAMLAVVTVVVTRAAGTDAPFRGWWILLPTAVVLVAEVLVGAVLGSWIGRWWLAPIAAVAVYAAQAAGAYGTISPVLVTGPGSTLLVGLTFGWRFASGQGLGAAGLAALCFGLLALRARARAGIAAWSVIVVGAVGLVVGWVVTDSLGDDARYVADTGLGLRCAGRLPQICLSADEVRPLDALAREFHRQAAPLIADGVDVPDRFVDLLPSSQLDFPDDGVVDLGSVDAAAATTADPSTVSWSLATPAPCAQYYRLRSGPIALDVRVVLADWIARQSDPSSRLQTGTRAEARWVDRPLDEQLDWVKPTYRALSTCDLRSVRLPW
jgi:hypothetical protein